MHLLIQRVAQASVQIDSQTHGSIGAGLLAFVCAEPADTTETVYKAVAKAGDACPTPDMKRRHP